MLPRDHVGILRALERPPLAPLSSARLVTRSDFSHTSRRDDALADTGTAAPPTALTGARHAIALGGAAMPQGWSVPAVITVIVALGAMALLVQRRRNAALVARARAAEASARRILAEEERFRLLFDRGADPQLLVDEQRIVAANPAAAALLGTGIGGLLGPLRAVLPDAAEPPTSRDAELAVETEAVDAGGTAIPVSLRRTVIPLDTGDLQHYQLRDLRDTRRLEAERRELEGQLLASQRLEALGTLAGGVAHDFNNLLTIIRANAEIATIALDEGDAPGVTESLDAVMQASDRARDIVKQILLFSRRAVPSHERINIAALITDTQTLLRATIPSTVQLLLEVRCAEAWIIADGTQMQQLLLNLCSNAEHAMRHTEGGMLRLTVDTLSLQDAPVAVRHPDLGPGDYVRLVVRDSGVGMTDDVRERIFEPFFTTKPVGEGTGLGLAVLHGIVLSHHGSVHVASVAGEGTQVELLFPRGEAQGEGAQGVPCPAPLSLRAITPRDDAAIGHAPPLILLVDDEPAVLRAAERGIRSAGMRVVTAPSASRALELLERLDDIAVMITDQTMPEMTGLALAERVRLLRPSLPIILSTGYTGRLAPDRLKAAGVRAMLDKPYTLAQLTEAIGVALATDRPPRATGPA